jgi:2-amino-4-hydroxy-6-hydroxymethyldihydropteridine diphosphokinase
MALVYLGLGANQGDCPRILSWAVEAIAAFTAPLALASLYKTAPQDFTQQADFYNTVLAVSTNLEPLQLLSHTQALEQTAGREREIPKGPRTLDIDILLWDNLVSTDPKLLLPHPRLCQRRFALQPLIEIAPQIQIPGCDPYYALAQTSQQGIYAIHPLDYNQPDTWIPPQWNLAKNQI